VGGIDRDLGKVICLAPAAAEDFAVSALTAYFAEVGGVCVLREQRRRERRGELRRRRVRTEPDDERRGVRNPNGRRVGERRRPVVQVRKPGLPPVVAAIARGAVFVSPIAGDDKRRASAETLRLVVRFQLGDEDAFREIYTRHFDGVYSYLLTALRDRHEAEDSAQEVFIRALRGLERFEFRGSPFEAWLFRIVRNHTLNVKRRAAPVSPAEPARIDLWRDDRERRAAIGSGRPGRDQDLLVFIERLPPPQRQVLVLRYKVGLDWADIAAVLDRSSGAVRQLEQRALSYLRRRLEAVEQGPTSRTDALPMARRIRPSPVSLQRRFALFGELRAA
jgi:RNA polymerase sigma-70 factor (ECF subfamily)